MENDFFRSLISHQGTVSCVELENPMRKFSFPVRVVFNIAERWCGRWWLHSKFAHVTVPLYCLNIWAPFLFCFFQTCRMHLTSFSTCNVNISPVTSCSEEQIKTHDPSQGGSSPSSKLSGTGCGPAAHTNDLDSGSSTGPPQSLNINQALISEPSFSAEPCREKPESEEMQRSPKRARRTWVRSWILTQALCNTGPQKKLFVQFNECYVHLNLSDFYTVFMLWSVCVYVKKSWRMICNNTM